MMPSPGATRGTPTLIEVLDRVLDRGIVIDAEMRLSLAGLHVVGVEARIVVAAIETYLGYANEIALTAPASWRTVEIESALDEADEELHGPGAHRLRGYLDDFGETP